MTKRILITSAAVLTLLVCLLPISCSNEDQVLPNGFEEACAGPVLPDRPEIGNFFYDGYMVEALTPGFSNYQGIGSEDLCPTCGSVWEDVLTLRTDNTFEWNRTKGTPWVGSWSLQNDELALVYDEKDTLFVVDHINEGYMKLLVRNQELQGIPAAVADSIASIREDLLAKDYSELLAASHEPFYADIFLIFTRVSVIRCLALD